MPLPWNGYGVGAAVTLGPGVRVFVGEAAGVAVRVRVGVRVFVADGRGVGVSVEVGRAVDVNVDVRVAVTEAVTVAVSDGEGVSGGAAVAVTDTWSGEAVRACNSPPVTGIRPSSDCGVAAVASTVCSARA